MKVFDLELIDSYYYIKRKTIVKPIVFNNRTFYAKFERIDEPLTPLLLEQHLNRDYTIAVPLLHNGTTNYLVIEYDGEESKRFYHLVKHLFKSMKIDNYFIYQGKNEEKIQIFIEVDRLPLNEAEKELQLYSNALEKKILKRWKMFPSSSLPISYNIVTLPYKKI